MIRWVAIIFLSLMIFSALLPWLSKLGVGHLPGDVRFKMFGQMICLPFGSTLIWSLVIMLVAKIL